MSNRGASIAGLLLSLLLSVALVCLVWLRIYLHHYELGPLFLRQSIGPVVLAGLYVPDAIVQLFGMPSYLYEIPPYSIAEQAWYRSGVVTTFVSAAFYYLLWLVGWRLIQRLTGRRGHPLAAARRAR